MFCEGWRGYTVNWKKFWTEQCTVLYCRDDEQQNLHSFMKSRLRRTEIAEFLSRFVQREKTNLRPAWLVLWTILAHDMRLVSLLLPPCKDGSNATDWCYFKTRQELALQSNLILVQIPFRNGSYYTTDSQIYSSCSAANITELSSDIWRFIDRIASCMCSNRLSARRLFQLPADPLPVVPL